MSWLRFILRHPPRLRGLPSEPSLSFWHSSSCRFPSFFANRICSRLACLPCCWFRYACHRNHGTFLAIYRIRRQTHSLQQRVSQRILQLCRSLCCRRIPRHRFEQILRRNQLPTLGRFNESTDQHGAQNFVPALQCCFALPQNPPALSSPARFPAQPSALSPRSCLRSWFRSCFCRSSAIAPSLREVLQMLSASGEILRSRFLAFELSVPLMATRSTRNKVSYRLKQPYSSQVSESRLLYLKGHGTHTGISALL